MFDHLSLSDCPWRIILFETLHPCEFYLNARFRAVNQKMGLCVREIIMSLEFFTVKYLQDLSLLKITSLQSVLFIKRRLIKELKG